MSDSQYWYAVYTRPKSEKKLAANLKNAGIEHYLPLLKTKQKWSDRFKWIEKPIFDSYIFVKINLEKHRKTVLRLPQSIRFVQSGAEIAEISEKDLDLLKISMESFPAFIRVLDTDSLLPGGNVVVKYGPFAGKEAQIRKIQNKTIILVSFPSLNRTIEVEIPLHDLGDQA